MAASSTRPVAGSVDEPAPIYVLGRSAATVKPAERDVQQRDNEADECD
jgi:hypothetical protein